MKSELVSWVSSLSPTAGALVATSVFLLPLAVDVIAGAGMGQPEFSERILDKLAGSAGAAIVGIVVIYFMFRLLMEVIAHMRAESIKKDETIAALIGKLGRE